MQNSSVEITDINVDGQLKVLQFIAKDCYARNGTSILKNSPWIELPHYFTVNNTANKFMVVGCDAIGVVNGKRLSRDYALGCTAQCEASDDLRLREGSCNGIGCCQTTVAEDVWRLNILLTTSSNYSDVWDFNNCGYGFVVEEKAFKFSKENLNALKEVERLPMVVDWAIGNGTCAEVEKNSATFACKSPISACYKPETGYGYRCRCLDGYQGNPYLEDGCQDTDECADSDLHDCAEKARCVNTVGNYTCSCPKGYSGNGRGPNGCTKKQEMKIAYVLMGIAFGITALLLSAILLHMEFKRRRSMKTRQTFFLQNGGVLLLEKLSRRETSQEASRIFSSTELHKATNNFHNSMIVGQGGFGTVYKGLLADNRVVAIKKSKKVDPNQIEQFINEVFVLSHVNHRNVVRLLGCCLETEAPLLVYEFINNGTLSSHIHDQVKARFFNWDVRLKIAAETAGVLSYLHSATSTPIIHRDVKPDNILIDDTFTAKVSDFGASKLVPLDLSQLSTMVQGTFGYLDPEYMQTNQLTEKSDVYSFGVVLLELLTGRKALSFDKAEEEKNLANFFLCLFKQERVLEILDHNIDRDRNMEQILEVARVAKGCLNVRGEDRPSMKEVAMELEGLILGGKHSWSRGGGTAEEVESLLFKGEEQPNLFANSISINGFDSIGYQVLLPMDGAR